MMTARRLSKIVPACGLVAKITLIQLSSFSARHFPHHSETTGHEVAGRGSVTLSTLPGAWRGVNVVCDEPGLGRVAECAILSEVPLMHVLHLVAGDTVEQLLLRRDRVV
jgi:hypothetical protein